MTVESRAVVQALAQLTLVLWPGMPSGQAVLGAPFGYASTRMCSANGRPSTPSALRARFTRIGSALAERDGQEKEDKEKRGGHGHDGCVGQSCWSSIKGVGGRDE